MVNAQLGPDYKPEAFEDDPDIETPVFKPYEDDEEEEATPDVETYDQYLNAEVLLPRGDSMVTGRVTGQKRDLP